MKSNGLYYLIGFFLLLGVFFLMGYIFYSKVFKCPEYSPDTLYVYDTIIKEIPDTIPFYITKTDTVIYRDTVFKDVDTAEILKEYFALHVYERLWLDSLVKVTLHDTISQNKPQGNTFVYKILKPQVVNNNVTNVYNYLRYITGGVSVPLKDIKYTNIELNYVTHRWYGGIGYDFGLNGFSIRGGMTIKKLK